MLDNPLAFMLVLSLGTMIASAILSIFSDKDIFGKMFLAGTSVFIVWGALITFILFFATI